MTSYVTYSEKSKFSNIWFREFDQSRPSRLIRFYVYFHSVWCIHPGLNIKLSALISLPDNSQTSTSNLFIGMKCWRYTMCEWCMIYYYCSITVIGIVYTRNSAGSQPPWYLSNDDELDSIVTSSLQNAHRSLPPINNVTSFQSFSKSTVLSFFILSTRYSACDKMFLKIWIHDCVNDANNNILLGIIKKQFQSATVI